ncbi:MAG: B12-binding domain-containing radical SAM protein, partial [Promethearchaeota archaeon]
CTFCCNHALKKLGHGPYIRFPSVSKCMEELEQAKEDTKMTGVAIHDDIFTLNKRWFREFAEEYRKRISLPYVCNLRVNCFNEDDVRYLKDSGCIIAILGIESGNEYIRNEIMRKGIKQEDIVKAYNLLHQYGIKTHSQNLIGVPCETPEHFLDTVRINARILPNNASLSVFYPYPGTVLYDRCVNDNLFINSANQKKFQERRDTKLKLPDFPRRYILFYVKNFKNLVQYEFFINKYRFFRKIFSLNPWNQIMVVFFMGIFSRFLLFYRGYCQNIPERLKKTFNFQ